jgi:integrase
MVLRGPNRWLLRVYIGQSSTGKNRYSSKIISGTTAEARKALTAMLREVDTKTFVEPTRELLSAYLESWLTGKIDVAPRTLVSYRRMLGYFLPQLGHRKLHEIDRSHVQAVLNEMTSQGLSRRTLEYAKAVIHGAFTDAIQDNRLVKNPADYIKLPPRVKRAPTVLSLAQVGALLEATQTHPFHGLWTLLLTTGLRPQEALALKWSDIDLDGSWLSVRRTLADDGHGKASLVESTKTDGSTRRIGLPSSTVATLRVYKARQSAEILKAGTRYTRFDLVFSSSVGTPLDHNLVRRAWKSTIKKAGLPAVRLYDCRHTHLTALLQNGADIAWVAARAGHSDVSMTARHYAHVLPETHREMGEMTERLMQQARK